MAVAVCPDEFECPALASQANQSTTGSKQSKSQEASVPGATWPPPSLDRHLGWPPFSEKSSRSEVTLVGLEPILSELVTRGARPKGCSP